MHKTLANVAQTALSARQNGGASRAASFGSLALSAKPLWLKGVAVQPERRHRFGLTALPFSPIGHADLAAWPADRGRDMPWRDLHGHGTGRPPWLQDAKMAESPRLDDSAIYRLLHRRCYSGSMATVICPAPERNSFMKAFSVSVVWLATMSA